MFIHGRNVVISALKTKQNIKKILISKTAHGDGIAEIKRLSRENGYDIQFLANQILDKKAKAGSVHQGVIAELEEFNFTSLKSLIETIKNSEKPLLTIVLDQITDPHNLGAVIRTAECAGCAGIIISEGNSADINATVLKVSVGAAFYLPIVKSRDLVHDLQVIKSNSIRLYATFSDADMSYTDVNKKEHSALVIGNEATGIRKIIKNQVDDLIKIPLLGQTDSLNASVAAGICIYGFVSK